MFPLSDIGAGHHQNVDFFWSFISGSETRLLWLTANIWASQRIELEYCDGPGPSHLSLPSRQPNVTQIS